MTPSKLIKISTSSVMFSNPYGQTQREVLLAQLERHPATPYLLRRQQLVNEFIDKYPDYFQKVADICVPLIKKGKVSLDQRQQILYGNTGQLLKLEGEFQEMVDSTAAAQRYHGIQRVLTTTTRAKAELETSLKAFLKSARQDYLESYPDAAIDSFNLETFNWSLKSLEYLSKRELRAKPLHSRENR